VAQSILNHLAQMDVLQRMVFAWQLTISMAGYGLADILLYSFCLFFAFSDG
jgi:hypothetical protein